MHLFLSPQNINKNKKCQRIINSSIVALKSIRFLASYQRGGCDLTTERSGHTKNTLYSVAACEDQIIFNLSSDQSMDWLRISSNLEASLLYAVSFYHQAILKTPRRVAKIKNSTNHKPKGETNTDKAFLALSAKNAQLCLFTDSMKKFS